MCRHLTMSQLVRFRLRTIMGLVALIAIALCTWELLFNPSRRWIRTIRDDDAGIRRWEAVSQARQGKVPGIDDTSAVAALTEALDDPSFRVRENAAAALGAFGPRAASAVPKLAKALRDETDRIVRMSIAGALFSILVKTHQADQETAARLVEGLEDSSRHVRILTAAALVEIGRADDALPTLIEGVKIPDASSRSYALWALERAGPPARAALPALIAMVNEPDEQGGSLMRFRRVQAAELLHQLGETELALRILRRGEQDGDRLLSQEASKVLRAISPTEGAR
jgi:HEAT repeat protein